jgi:hypothetical protein
VTSRRARTRDSKVRDDDKNRTCSERHAVAAAQH